MAPWHETAFVYSPAAMPRFLLAAVLLAGCALEPDTTVFAPSGDKCRTKGCNWADFKAARLASCKAKNPKTGVMAAECMGEFLAYHGTRACIDTRAWVTRVGAGISED